MSAEPSSFRDPAAQVHRLDGRIFRVIKPAARESFEALTTANFFHRMVDSGRLIESTRVTNPGLEDTTNEDLVVEHPVLPFISFPYEWPFAMLQAAALHHLDLQIEALEEDFVLIDASAYNIQFQSSTPIFIDVTSFRPYQDGESWFAHHQFCESFLAPLVLQARVGIPYQAWYRGNLEGVPITDVARLLRFRDYLSPTLLGHIALPSALSRRKKASLQSTAVKNAAKGLPKTRYAAILKQLHHFIKHLSPKRAEGSIWADYSSENTYLPHETKQKLNVVSSFCNQYRPEIILDIGCNDGVYSACALRNGAAAAIGLDTDQGALHRAYLRANAENLPFVALCTDLANPPPNQGFAEVERASLKTRLKHVESVLALAVIHHLVIARNIPLNRAVEWIVSFGNTGLIEFVPKSDQTIQEMLTLREDIFSSYTRADFVTALEAKATIISSTIVSNTGREIFHFQAK